MIGSGLPEAPPAAARCVHELVEERARERPDAIAVVVGDSTLAYGELTRRARQLGSRLAARGVRQDCVVAIAADRSADLMIALLGVLEAGAAYLVIDPELPHARVARLLADARPAVLLAQQSLLPGFSQAGTDVLGLESELALAGQLAGPVCLPAAHLDQLAYVSYTSGSTGEPKGVAVPHRGVVRLVLGPDWAEFGIDDVFLQVAPVAFDASTLEIWAPLVNGGCLVLYPQGVVTAERLGGLVHRCGVTVLSLTAGLFHQLADDAPELFGGVRHLFAGGDVVSAAHVAAVLAAHPGITFTHAYGPTENTTFTTVCAIERTAPGEVLPIGRPISGTSVAILDDALRPVPAGTAGELYAAGDGLARGYLHRPADTAERFLPAPFGQPSGARMYRTGDLARWRDDGMIDFLGRADAQVKVGGYRVELGEIESRLREDPLVRDAVVLARAGADGDRELAAYLVPAQEITDPAAEAARLRERLAEVLPPVMIPRTFQSVSSMPLNVNGKVDRAALAVDGGAVPLGRGVTQRPGTLLESTIAEAWDLVLGTQVGVEDNFFEAGGNSLLLIRLRARLGRLLGRKIPTVALFDHPTIRQQAQFLAAEAGTGPDLAQRPGVAQGPQGPQKPPGPDTERPARRRQALREQSLRRAGERRG